MKKINILLILSIFITLLFSACQPAGVPQAQYDQLNTQLQASQSQLTKAQNDLAKAQADKSTSDKDLAAAKAQIADLQNQISQSSLAGATPAESAAKIVKNYASTHVYSSADYFVCSDMSAEVWNMLKAQNIPAVIMVGDTEKGIADILQSTHAWVMVTVGVNEYLALETTGGYPVKKTEFPLYYRGWAFASPAELKSNNDLRNEYNIRVALRNQLNHECNNAINDPALYNKLVVLRTAQETELNKIMAKINSLAKPVNY